MFQMCLAVLVVQIRLVDANFLAAELADFKWDSGCLVVKDCWFPQFRIKGFNYSTKETLSGTWFLRNGSSKVEL